MNNEICKVYKMELRGKVKGAYYIGEFAVPSWRDKTTDMNEAIKHFRIKEEGEYLLVYRDSSNTPSLFNLKSSQAVCISEW